jgi:hypothetical protein
MAMTCEHQSCDNELLGLVGGEGVLVLVNPVLEPGLLNREIYKYTFHFHHHGVVWL